MGRKSVKGRGDSVIFPFHYVSTTSLNGSGLASFILAPTGSISPRALVEADAWAHFRVRAFRFRLHPATTASVTTLVIGGYVGGVQDTTPATFAQISELIPSVVLGQSTTVPSDWCVVPAVDLAGPLPWYKTIAGAADATEEAPGLVCLFGATASANYILEMRGVFEFKTAVSAGNTPSALSLLARVREERKLVVLKREREQLLGILGSVASTGKTTVAAGPNP